MKIWGDLFPSLLPLIPHGSQFIVFDFPLVSHEPEKILLLRLFNVWFFPRFSLHFSPPYLNLALITIYPICFGK